MVFSFVFSCFQLDFYFSFSFFELFAFLTSFSDSSELTSILFFFLSFTDLNLETNASLILSLIILVLALSSCYFLTAQMGSPFESTLSLFFNFFVFFYFFVWECSDSPLDDLADFLPFRVVLSFSFYFVVLDLTLVLILSSGSAFLLLAFFFAEALFSELAGESVFFFFFFALAIFLAISSFSLEANLLVEPCLLETLSFLLLDFFFLTSDSSLSELSLRLEDFSFFFLETLSFSASYNCCFIFLALVFSFLTERLSEWLLLGLGSCFASSGTSA